MDAVLFRNTLFKIKEKIEKTPGYENSTLYKHINNSYTQIETALSPGNKNPVDKRYPFLTKEDLKQAEELKLLCPKTGKIMENPVKLRHLNDKYGIVTGHTFDKLQFMIKKPAVRLMFVQPPVDLLMIILMIKDKKREIQAFLKIKEEKYNQSLRGQNPADTIPPAQARDAATPAPMRYK